MLTDTLKHVDEVFVRIDVVEPTGRQQALDNVYMSGAKLGPAEQAVLFTHRDDPQGALEVVRVDQYLRVIHVDRQADAAFTDIRERTEEGAARQESLFIELLVDPGEEALKDRFRLFLAACELCLSSQAIVVDPLFNLLEGCDRVQRLVDLRRLDIPGIKDLAACVCPTLHMRDSRLLRVMLISAVAIALQYGTAWPGQT